MAVKYDPILDALREADTSGSSDTASNLGTGVGIFSNKNSGVFYFNSLADSTTIGVSTASGGNIALNLISIPSSLIPDPLSVNNLSVHSTASINRLDVKNTYFSLTGGATPLVEGQLSWDSALGHLGYGLPGGNVELAIGMENVLPRRCKNSSGTTMTKGTVVYISSVSGNNPVVSRARANTDATSAFTIGVCAEDIPDGQKGWITTYGVVSGLNLSSYTAGDTVYLSGTTAGEFTKTKPYAPTHYVRIGIVTKATSSGDLYVQVLNGFEMDELHNVSAQSAASGDILRYNGSTNLWETQSLIKPLTKTVTSGQFLDSYDATTGVFTSSTPTHNSTSGIQGGTAGEYNHLTNAQVTNLNNQSGTNTGDETKTSIETKLGAATSSNNGYLTSTDWNTFNNKQAALGYTPANQTTTISTTAPLSGGGDLSANRTLSMSAANTTTDGYLKSADWNTFNGKLTPNSPITGATKTKITYDANGLVTAGADATTADIADSTNKRYVTDAQLTVIGNTSGTNTGDVTVTDTSTIDFTLTGQALTGSVIQSGITHNNLGSLQGGTTGQYYHLTSAQLTNLGNQSGTNTGDITVTDSSTIDFTLTGQSLTASVIQGGITHNNLAGLTTGDPHTQYLYLNNRGSTQTVNDKVVIKSSATSGNLLELQYTSTGTSGDSIGAYFNYTDTGGGVKTVYAHRASLYYSGTGTISGTQATSNQIIINGGGIVNNAEILTSNLTISNGSTVSEANLIKIYAPTLSIGSTLTTLRGIYIADMSAGATNWSIYSLGGKMYHAGQIQSGDGTASAPAFSFVNETNTGFYRVTTGDYSFTSEGTRIMTLSNDNRVLIGATNVATNPDAKVEIASTTSALLLPRMTQTQRDALTAVNGMLIYNSTSGTVQARNAGAWVSL